MVMALTGTDLKRCLNIAVISHTLSSEVLIQKA